MRLQGVGQCPMRDVEIQVSDIISAHGYLRGVMSAALQQCLFFNILLSLTGGGGGGGGVSRPCAPLRPCVKTGFA